MVSIILIIYSNKHKNLYIIKSSYILGTIINLKLYGRNANKAVDEAIKKLNEIDDKMSAFKEDSEISKINLKAGKESQKVSKDTYYVIKEAIKYSKILYGTFDPTIRPLVNLWGIGTKEEKLPKKAEIDEILKLVSYKDIIINKSNNSIMLRNKNQALDVGGIAKGYAADEVRNIFNKFNIKNAIIDLGGNIFALGNKNDGTPWKVGIQNPFKPRGEYIGIVSVMSKSIVTSGNYERYFVKEGKKFHHIIDPKTGYPSDSNIISATIISNNSIDGDGLSTGIYILGIEKSMKIIESIEGVCGIFITKDREVYITSGAEEIFTLTEKNFNLKSLNKFSF